MHKRTRTLLTTGLLVPLWAPVEALEVTKWLRFRIGPKRTGHLDQRGFPHGLSTLHDITSNVIFSSQEFFDLRGWGGLRRCEILVRGGRRVGQEGVRDRGTQERQQTGGGATHTHRTREPHQEGQGRAQQTRRSGTARQERQSEQREQGTRMEGMGERAHGRQRQQRGWPGQSAPSLPGARATPAQPASGWGCLRQPRWAVCATGAGAHQGQTGREGEKDIWWTAGTARGGTGHLGLAHTETQRGRLWTACGQRRVDSKNSQTTPATTSTSSIRQLWGATDAQTAHHATFSTAPTHQPLGSANAE